MAPWRVPPSHRPVPTLARSCPERRPLSYAGWRRRERVMFVPFGVLVGLLVRRVRLVVPARAPHPSAERLPALRLSDRPGRPAPEHARRGCTFRPIGWWPDARPGTGRRRVTRLRRSGHRMLRSGVLDRKIEHRDPHRPGRALPRPRRLHRQHLPVAGGGAAAGCRSGRGVPGTRRRRWARARDRGRPRRAPVRWPATR